MSKVIRDYLIEILDECYYLINESKFLDFNSFIENKHLKVSFLRSLEFIEARLLSS